MYVYSSRLLYALGIFTPIHTTGVKESTVEDYQEPYALAPEVCLYPSFTTDRRVPEGEGNPVRK